MIQFTKTMIQKIYTELAILIITEEELSIICIEFLSIQSHYVSL